MTKAYFLFIREIKTEVSSPTGLTSPSAPPDPVIDLLKKEYQTDTIKPIDSINVFALEGTETKSSLIEAVFTYYQILKLNTKK